MVEKFYNPIVPHDTNTFLTAGPKFWINPSLKQIGLYRLLSYAEYIIENIDDNKKNICKGKVTNILTNYCITFNKNYCNGYISR